jgi:para-nitrobenzyl esterase
LFRAAIPQSGAAHHTLPKAAGEWCAEKLMGTLKARTPEALAAVSTEELLDAQERISAEIGQDAGSMGIFGVAVAPFYPVEGNSVIPKNPLAAIAEGVSSEIPVLTGSNHDETTLWGYGAMDSDKLQRAAASYGADQVLDVYRQTRPNATIEELMIAMTTDHMFRIPAIRLVEARLQADPSSRNWMYLFCWKSRAFEGRLGATHSLEIPFAFDNLDKGGVEVFIGPGAKPQHVADVMHRSWTGFIADLDPGWGAYALDERTTMCFDDESETVMDPDATERKAWEGIR